MLPVGFDGELIIIPFTELEIFDFNDSSFGSKLFSLSVSTKTGFASARDINSGNETQ